MLWRSGYTEEVPGDSSRKAQVCDHPRLHTRHIPGEDSRRSQHSAFAVTPSILKLLRCVPDLIETRNPPSALCKSPTHKILECNKMLLYANNLGLDMPGQLTRTVCKKSTWSRVQHRQPWGTVCTRAFLLCLFSLGCNSLSTVGKILPRKSNLEDGSIKTSDGDKIALLANACSTEARAQTESQGLLLHHTIAT